MSPVWQPAPTKPVLGMGEAHVWYCDFSEISDFAAGLDVLSEIERQHAARFKTDESKLTFIGSHIFLRRVLGSYLRISAAGVRLSVEVGGKPYLDNLVHPGDLQFNLSHSHCSAVCAIARYVRVGIDLERPDPKLCDDGAAKQVFGPGELRCLSEQEPAERVAAFFRGWTKKEAYAKCKGTGLSSDLTELEMGFSEGGSVFGGLSLLSFQCPNGFVAALALEGRPVPITFWTLPPQHLIDFQ